MKLNKVIPILFISLLTLFTVILAYLCAETNSLLNDSTLSAQNLLVEYNSMQQQTSYTSISFFGILLIIGFIHYYKNQNMKYIIWSNLVYIPVTLFSFVSLNIKFYELQGLVPSETDGFWLLLFIGIFYIIGAVLVSVIGAFTIRNLNKRMGRK